MCDIIHIVLKYNVGGDNVSALQKISVKGFVVYFAIIAIAVLLAFNYQLFIVENGFAPAGLNGIATMIQ